MYGLLKSRNLLDANAKATPEMVTEKIHQYKAELLPDGVSDGPLIEGMSNPSIAVSC